MGLFSRTLSRLDELKRALTKEPASRQFLALADEHRRQGQVPEAISVLEKGLALDPSSVAGHVALGRLLQQSGRGESAIASFQTALRLDPQNLVALRQAADLFLAKGDKVEAIKRLKLFRGLSPGDREVNEIIRQLDEELAATAAPGPPSRASTGAAPHLTAEPGVYPPPRPPSPFATGEIAVAPLSAPDAAGEIAPVAPSSLGAEEATAEAEAGPGPLLASVRQEAVPGIAAEAAPLLAPFRDAASPPAAPLAAAPPAAELEAVPELAAEPFETFSAQPVGPAPPEAFPPPPVPSAAGSPQAHPSPSGPPAATETLAALLRAQGHLGEAEEAYRELAARESDPARAARFHGLAGEIAGARVATPRGRLEAWAAPFTRALGPRETDLVAAVEEAVRRIGPSSAVVTDLEGVPVVSIGPRGDAEAMETLAAELTAFWKNVRRSRAEIGEGALDGLVLSCSAGTAVVRSITPSYALLVRAGTGIPAGRLRFEAARAAEQLRPALV